MDDDFQENESGLNLFATVCNPARVDMTRPKRYSSLHGLRFPSRSGEGISVLGTGPSGSPAHSRSSQMSKSSRRSQNSRSQSVRSVASLRSATSYFDEADLAAADDELNERAATAEEVTDESAYKHERRRERRDTQLHSRTGATQELDMQSDHEARESYHDVFEPRAPDPFEPRAPDPFESGTPDSFGARAPDVFESQDNRRSSPLRHALSPRSPVDPLQDELLEKQTALMELERLHKTHGIRPSRNYSINDRLSDIQFEVRRHLCTIDESNMVSFMGDSMRLICTGFELANSRLGPFLEMDGWCEAVTSDMSRYEGALSRLYRKHWKRSTMSPEFELAFAMVSSIGIHHFKKKAQSLIFGDPIRKESRGEHNGPGVIPFQSSAPSQPVNGAATDSVLPTVPPLSCDSVEGMPPGSPSVPESVPLSARKRLVFN